MPEAPKGSDLSVTTDVPVSDYVGLTSRDPVTATINLPTYPLCQRLLNPAPCNHVRASKEAWAPIGGEASRHNLGNESNPSCVVVFLLVQRERNVRKAHFPEWPDPDTRRSWQTFTRTFRLCTHSARATCGTFAEYSSIHMEKGHGQFLKAANSLPVPALIVDCSGFALLTSAQTAKHPILVT